MASIGQFTSKALLPSQAEATQETQNQTIASLQAQFQDLAKQLADAKASASTTAESTDTKTTKPK